MARELMASMLDELMGRDRNERPEDKRELKWSDGEVCKYYLVKFCPNDLFTNTKADLGACQNIHSDKLKEKYEQSDRQGKFGYEDDFYRYLQHLIFDVDKRIRKAGERIQLTKQVIEGQSQSSSIEQDAEIKAINDQISALITQVNELGAEGDVEESAKKMSQIERLKKDKERVTKTRERVSETVMSTVERQLEVCQVCGAYLAVGDAQQRIDDHLIGKQHRGYATVRNAMQEYEEKRKEEREKREKTKLERQKLNSAERASYEKVHKKRSASRDYPDSRRRRRRYSDSDDEYDDRRRDYRRSSSHRTNYRDSSSRYESRGYRDDRRHRESDRRRRASDSESDEERDEYYERRRRRDERSRSKER